MTVKAQTTRTGVLSVVQRVVEFFRRRAPATRGVSPGQMVSKGEPMVEFE